MGDEELKILRDKLFRNFLLYGKQRVSLGGRVTQVMRMFCYDGKSKAR